MLSVAAGRQRETKPVAGTGLRIGNGVLGVTSQTGAPLYDSTTLAPVTVLRPDDQVVGLDFAPDGRVVVADAEGRVTLHSSPVAEPVVLRESGEWGRAWFIDDGRAVVIGRQVWDVQARTLRTEIPVGPESLWWDAYDDTLVTSSGRSVSLWSLKTGQRTGGFDLGTEVRTAKLLHGGLLAIATVEDDLRLWNTRTGTPVRSLTPPSGWLTTAVSADRTVLAVAGSGDTQVKLWDVVHDAALPPIRVDTTTSEIAFTRDGRLVWSAGTTLRVLPRSAVPVASAHAVRALAIDRDGSVLTFDEAGVIERRDTALRSLSRITTGAPGRALACFSPDRRQLATSGGTEIAAVRRTSDGRLDTTSGDGFPPAALAFGGGLLYAGASRTATVLTDTAKTIDTTKEGPPTAAAFGRTDREIVLGTEWGLVVIKDVRTDDDFNLGAVHEGPVRALAMSPDQRTLATAGDDGVVLLWDTETWKKKGELRGHTGTVGALAFSPDSSRIASGGNDKTVVVWDVNTTQAWATLRGHAEGVTHVAWMPDGRAVVSAAADALLVWQLDVDKALTTLG
ncbi:WD40 repeat domain-containing protein [Lentzea sp. NPDC058450]|uniref:WD40 repeat domain-containing protein n=1 Tax=Lentzea sp. NPDC058450 TaxID=3346505 RepID=UPI003655F439